MRTPRSGARMGAWEPSPNPSPDLPVPGSRPPPQHPQPNTHPDSPISGPVLHAP
jgi:hypothetical protein